MYDELLKRYDEVSRFKKEQWTEMEHGAYFSWSEFEMVDQMAIAIRDLTAKLEAANSDCVTFRNAKNRAEEKADHLQQTLEATAVPGRLDAVKPRTFRMGQRVTKMRGSKWTGNIVGLYSTDLTPIGYAVESETEIGSVQIYPEAALTALEKT